MSNSQTAVTHVLMVEDSVSLAAIYEAYLDATLYRVVTVTTLDEARQAYGSNRPDIVLLDVELPDGSGLDFLDEIMAEDDPAKVIVMTAHGTSDMAIVAVQKGAVDFLTKPFGAPRLRVTVDNAQKQLRLTQQVEALSKPARDGFCGFIGNSTAMQSVYTTIESLAQSDASGFIVGESGTGKELAAEAIHSRSNRAKRGFIALNCGAIPGQLMESEIFGHVKGAFTGASAARDGAATLADGGTLFLDEICEMDLELQKKLLRFIQSGTFQKVGSNKTESVDVRFVCATNRDPLREVREGRFREDLFYRLHVVPVRLPPLRERGDDILRLAEFFLEKFAEAAGKDFTGFDARASELLKRYPWPGNVRQIQNTIQQVVVLNKGDRVLADMLPEEVQVGHLASASSSDRAPSLPSSPSPSPAIDGTDPRHTVEPLWLVEKRAIEGAIAACDGNVNRAAGLLEVSASTIYRKRQSWTE